jgi:lipopolysaccharide export LptBFGC system permease protein LptF
VSFDESIQKSDLKNGRTQIGNVPNDPIVEEVNPFRPVAAKPSYLTVAGIKEQMAAGGSEFEHRSFAIALEKKYTTLVLPFVIVLFTAPFAFSLNRRVKAGRVGYAIALWLLFTGLASLFEQFGLIGSLSPAAAVWSPLLVFSMLGVFLLSKIRT